MKPRDAQLVPQGAITIHGARQNNLKNLDVAIPLNELVVVTGVSGSGKSSLVFDTLYAEGQRRYVETFSPYARQFLDRMDKPAVDRIDGVPPAIAIDQTNPVRTSRSTVGTMTELNDHVKLLFARAARLYCRGCGAPVRRDTPDSIFAQMQSRSQAASDPRLLVTFPVSVPKNFSEAEVRELLGQQGYTRIHSHRGEVLEVVQDRFRMPNAERARVIEALEAALRVGQGRVNVHLVPDADETVAEGTRREAGGARAEGASGEGASPEAASGGLADRLAPRASRLAPPQTWRFSTSLHCPDCDIAYNEPTPSLFSFNSPLGACDTCRGFGRVIGIDFGLIIPDESKTLREGAIKPWQTPSFSECQDDLKKYAPKRGVPMDVPWRDMRAEDKRWVLEGDDDWVSWRKSWPGKWYGVRRFFDWLESKSYKMHIRVLLSKYRAYTPCTACDGARLKPDALLWRLGTKEDADRVLPAEQRFRPHGLRLPDALLAALPGLTVHDLMLLAIDRSREFFAHLHLPWTPLRRAPPTPDRAAADVRSVDGAPSPAGDEVPPSGVPLDEATDLLLTEIRARLSYLSQVGLGYLTLDRQSRTLSGGEVQRINLTTALGTSLVNTLFVLDEPSIGLHPRDMGRVIEVMKRLRNAGNSLVVVEHDPQIMLEADRILDMGPGPGERGGTIVFFDSPAALARAGTITAEYLSGRQRADAGVASSPVHAGHPQIDVLGATEHNLKGIDVSIPLNRLVCITGVSGSGKSTLVQDVLYAGLLKHKGKPTEAPGAHRAVIGHELIGEVVMVDQTPIGRTTRSNPASYVGAFDAIRQIFAKEPLASERGYTPGTFSFNSGNGRCPTCGGNGFEHVEMQFLSDVYLRCPDCNGKRYRDEVLEVTVQGQGAAAGKSMADVLEMTVSEAVGFFADQPEVLRTLRPLADVGLEYLKLGQPVPTLSGGEAQRLKLAGHLAEAGRITPALRATPPQAGSRHPAAFGGTPPQAGGENPPALRATHSRTSETPLPSSLRRDVSEADGVVGGSLFLFDEPTTGLHFDDIAKLLGAFRKLLAAGHSLVVIEHNLDVIRASDWLIDLGPEGGEGGGALVCAGSPEQVAAHPASHTGAALRDYEASLGRMATPLAGAEDGEERGLSHHVPRASSLPATPAASSTAHGVAESGAAACAPLRVRIPASEAPAPRSEGTIRIHNAREHNLKSVDVDIPREKFSVITGVSGSGKSTLAFDILFAEGQRRYLESLNAYARQFVQPAARPDVDAIFGIPPTVAIEQRTSRGGSKSTVATLTELYHFLRLLYVKLGTQFCPACDVPIQPQSFESIAARLLRDYRGQHIGLLAPLVVNRKGYYTDLAKWAAAKGFSHLRVDGEFLPTGKWPRLSRFQEHTIELPVADLQVGADAEPQLREALARALDFGKGVVHVVAPLDGLMEGNAKVTDAVLSTKRACPSCGTSFPELDPRLFSFNSKHGWCESCFGTGLQIEQVGWDEEREKTGTEDQVLDSWVEWLQLDEPCPACQGRRLNPTALHVRFHQRSIADLAALPVTEVARFFEELAVAGREAEIARDILAELRARLSFLQEVGLGYLALDRSAPTLSGGEAQRIRLASQLGSNLRGVCYILDEPTIGLHPRDNRILLDTLAKLEAKGNTLVVVEHDEDTIRRAEHVIDLGPGAGTLGGRIVAQGSAEELTANPASLTGRFLAQPLRHPLQPRRAVVPDTPAIEVRGAELHNLKDVDVRIPLGRLTVVTGVSGSGKSTLARDVLYASLHQVLGDQRRKAAAQPFGCRAIEGWDQLGRVLEVDQTPIGKTPRSCPATYVGFWDAVRKLFAETTEARMRGYGPGRFSFNSAGGRCENCEGQGVKKIEMSFLPDVKVACEAFGGQRFSPETLMVRFKGKSAGEVLAMSVDEATEFFAAHRSIHHALRLLQDVGLGYLTLGQQSPTLSGGEAQRIKLVTELSKVRAQTPDLPARERARARGLNHTLYVLDEPTVGLHMADVEKLLRVLHRLVDAGNSVVVIEHNLDVMAEADWIVDLGPEGGDAGGRVVAQCAPEDIVRVRNGSHTARVLGAFLRERTR
jgi:excinuclease ABC subunit A